jgi:hypothetical protein
MRHISLGFGSEFASSLEMDATAKIAFLVVSVVAVLTNLTMPDASNQMLADLGRVPDATMHEYVRTTTLNFMEVYVQSLAGLATYLQVGMAFYRRSGSEGSTRGRHCVLDCGVFMFQQEAQLSGGSSHYTIKEADVWSPPVRVAAWRYVNE